MGTVQLLLPAVFGDYPQHVGDAFTKQSFATIVPGLVLAPAVEDGRDGQRA
jgi:hypothetical protein